MGIQDLDPSQRGTIQPDDDTRYDLNAANAKVITESAERFFGYHPDGTNKLVRRDLENAPLFLKRGDQMLPEHREQGAILEIDRYTYRLDPQSGGQTAIQTTYIFYPDSVHRREVVAKPRRLSSGGSGLIPYSDEPFQEPQTEPTVHPYELFQLARNVARSVPYNPQAEQ